MNINCEDILLAMMAVTDGEESNFSAAQIETHSANCPNCRQEIEQMQSVDKFFRMQKRREQNVSLWSAIEPNIITKPEIVKQSNLSIFLLLIVSLIVYKLLEMLPERDFGLSFKIIPIILVVALFAFLKENPFKINTELTLEK